MSLTLHGYWRSGTSYRVRIALALKGIAYEQVGHDLRTGAHRAPGYAAINPQRLVPTLDADGILLTQSPAILEWIEEVYPDPPLLPADPAGRAIVRAMAAVVACDIHPLNNMRVLNSLRADLDAEPIEVEAWTAHWISEGFSALEAMVAAHGGSFAFGDTPTLADCHLVPQVYSAERFKVNLTPYPRLLAAATNARALAPFMAARPDAQPDAARA